MTPTELLALADAATPGPWKLVDDYDVEAQGVSLFIGANDYTASVTKPQDARLIALAPDLARSLAVAWKALEEMGCLSEGANCEIRPTDSPCPRCAALAKLRELEVRA